MNSMIKPITYRDSGVDIYEGDRFVSLIAPIARATFRKEVLADIGSFGSLFCIDAKKYKEPVLVSGTDGVGTKLKVAFMMDRHDTVGIDLVAMCVNDILTLGAEPLFFLDYFATGKLKPEKAAEVIRGIAIGCKEAGCSLIGGETAEMPDFYGPEEYDLAGFAVGIVEKDAVVTGSEVKEGDVVVGLPSKGLHSNGYSLARKVFFERLGWSVDKYVPELNSTLGEALLVPTCIYVDTIKGLSEVIKMKAMAHITGGGLAGNLSRVLPKGFSAQIVKGSWKELPIFNLIKEAGNVPEDDLRRTFNMGLGYVIICAEEDMKALKDYFVSKGQDYFVIGSIVNSEGGVFYV